jgi:predicted transglutaminase-like cysteine proteinase
MRRAVKVLAAASMMAATFWASISEAAFFSFPRALKFQVEQISFEAPALTPVGHTRFCQQYKDDCEIQGVDFRHRNIALTADRWEELTSVNRAVNRSIIPQRNLGGLLTEVWLVAPRAGECHDYAVTKRHELLEHGWPSRSLLLSEVVTVSGEHHLVLIVRMKDVDLVLDSLNPNVRPVTQTNYKWLRAETPGNPRYWSTVSVPSRQHGATLPG